MDMIPRLSSNLNPFNEDLKIIDFTLLRLRKGPNIYAVPVYVLTDRIPSRLGLIDPYETMIRIGFSDTYVFLYSVEERCSSKFAAYSQHQRILKKLLKGFYNKEIISVVEGGVSCKMFNCR